MNNINVSKLVANLLSGLDGRQREVLEGRYGLKDGVVKTLAEIGEKYGITRERIRQIEASALNDVKVVFDKNGAKEFVNLVKAHLKNIGGLRQEGLLLTDLKMMVGDANSSYLQNKTRFILEIANEPKYSLENNNFHNFWYLADEDKKKAATLISKLIKLMESNRGTVVSHQNVDSLFNEAIKPHNLKDLVALNFISASKQFHVNEYGDFGLANWSEVNPRTVRDWAHLILKKGEKPLHFQDIAKAINKIRKDAKRLAHPQTVHNELIKDPRFVLVGRGTYGLQEFGFIPGTAREVMARLLEKHGPLKPSELLEQVLKERMFKKNTVFINLQNKKYFKRLEDGRYTTLA